MQRTQRANVFLGKAVMKSVLSERFATLNYLRIAELSTEPAQVKRALDDSREEARHARALIKAARRDGIPVSEADGVDHQMEELREAFATLADAGDRAACVFAQDIVLEHVAIHLYEALLVGARNGNAPVLAALLERILLDEHQHVASAVVELRTEFTADERHGALARAMRVLMPLLLTYGAVRPGTPCGRICATCRDRCCQLDAEEVAMPFGGGSDRLFGALKTTLLAIESAA